MRGSGKHGKPKRKQFVADRPFEFFIVNRKTKAILFCGKVENPLNK